MTETLANLVSQLRAAWDAWEQAKRDAREAGVMNPPEVIRLANLTMKLEGQVRLARQGKFRKVTPAGHVECGRCGGYGGHNQWPGFVCFKCDGIGHIPS